MKRIFASNPKKMQVHQRWKPLEESPEFQRVLADEEALALSKNLDAEIKKLFPPDGEKS